MSSHDETFNSTNKDSVDSSSLNIDREQETGTIQNLAEVKLAANGPIIGQAKIRTIKKEIEQDEVVSPSDITLEAILTDPNNEKIQYQILLNGQKIFPEDGTQWSNFIDSNQSIKHLIAAKKLNIENLDKNIENIPQINGVVFKNTNIGRTGQIQQYIIPRTSSYRITAYGAQGAPATATTGGLGAKMSGVFELQKGTVLRILVGQQGHHNANRLHLSSPGGGGSFVALANNQPLVVAGGGGGTGNERPLLSNATITIRANNGRASSNTAGDNGNGGSTGFLLAGGGGGLLTNGMLNANSGGNAFVNGGSGGIASVDNESGGGFGGGGSITHGGISLYGGGGGYSGGGGSSTSSGTAGSWGGGGGSFNSGTKQENQAGARSGHGLVIIESMTGFNDITMVARDQTGLQTSWTTTFTAVNLLPRISAEHDYFSVFGVLSDPDSNKVAYRLLINGTQIFPKDGQTINGKKYTPYFDSPKTFRRDWDSSHLLFGKSNEVILEVIDEFGGIGQLSFSVIGTYKGLLFRDEKGNYYTTDIGIPLQVLDFGTVVAGQTTLPRKVTIENRLWESIKDTEIKVDMPDIPNATIEISKTDLPFVPEPERLFYEELLHNNETIDFYVRLKTNKQAQFGSDFKIRARTSSVKSNE